MRLRSRTAALAAATALGLAAATGVALATGLVNLNGDDLRRPGTITINESTLPENDSAEQAALAELATIDRDAARSAAARCAR